MSKISKTLFFANYVFMKYEIELVVVATSFLFC